VVKKEEKQDSAATARARHRIAHRRAAARWKAKAEKGLRDGGERRRLLRRNRVHCISLIDDIRTAGMPRRVRHRKAKPGPIIEQSRPMKAFASYFC